MITIHAAQSLGREFFNIDFPCSPQDLKSAFRRVAKALHTDTSGMNTKDRFVAMKDAYDNILELAQATPGFFVESDGSTTTATAFLKTVEGILLAELGLGLGPTKNGRDCPSCSHRGYHESFGESYRVCDKCDHHGMIATPERVFCNACHGTGRFQQRRTLRFVTCLACNGSGRREVMSGRRFCPDCHGTKTIHVRTPQKFYRRCATCDGAGELPMFNPVIIKGALHA